VRLRQQRARAQRVSRRMVMQGDGQLDESLKEAFLRPGGLAPNVLEHLVSVEEAGVIEQLDARPVSLTADP